MCDPGSLWLKLQPQPRLLSVYVMRVLNVFMSRGFDGASSSDPSVRVAPE